MKYLVVSDTHYDNDKLEHITLNFAPTVDFMIHCGDSSLEVDSHYLKDYFVVKGNHDDGDFPIYIVKENVFITHGHKYDVYQTYDLLIKECKEHHTNICFHGHTHVPTHQIIEGIHFINPGSVMINRGSYGFGTFALVNVSDKTVEVTYLNSETFEVCNDIVLDEGLKLLQEFKDILKSKT